MTKIQSRLYTLFLFLYTLVQLSFSQEGFPQAIIEAMSTREERYHHYLWHNIRDNWNRYDNATQNEIRDRGWDPPRPARDFDEDGNSIAIIDNDSGEDFLYMHRQMVASVRAMVENDTDAAEYLASWEAIPAPEDEDYPVPENYTVGSTQTTNVIERQKTDTFYEENIIPMEDLFTDPVQLRNMTLGQLGSRIENTIHNWLHIRFSANESYGYRAGGSGPFPLFDERWDNSSYDWLGDTYSSHVNPVFWKLHGWVDDRVEDWRIANDIEEIEWVGTWEGGPMDTLTDVLEPEEEISVDWDPGVSVSSVGTTATDSGPVIESSFADDVQVDLGTGAR